MSLSDLTGRPWDRRLAHLCVRPLVDSVVTPNHITLVSLVSGLLAGILFAGGGFAAYWGAGFFVLSAFADHADGELARLGGKSTRFGHYFDLLAGAIGKVALFVGMGWGLQESFLGDWAVTLGVLAGVSVAFIFLLRMGLERRLGKESTAQPVWAGFEIEDVLYLVGPIAWMDSLPLFLIAAGIGAPAYLVWQVWELLQMVGSD